MKRMAQLAVGGVTALVFLSALTAAQPPAGGPGGGPPGGQRRGPPSPERMVEHAMTFDTDGDGKLDRGELTKFAEEMHAMRARGGEPGGPGGPGGLQGGNGQRRGPALGRGPRDIGPGPGDAPGEGKRPGRPDRSERTDRPERPERPE